jgi:hypothetical protein
MLTNYQDPARTLDLLARLEAMGFTDQAFRAIHHFSQPTTIAAHKRYCEDLAEEKGTFGTNTNRLVQRRLEVILCMCQAAGIEQPSPAQFEHLAQVALLSYPHDKRPLGEQYAENARGDGSAA